MIILINESQLKKIIKDIIWTQNFF
jgi:hypothetical protein